MANENTSIWVRCSQFSLRTLMLLCVVAAIALTLLPEEEAGRELPGGWTILGQTRVQGGLQASPGGFGFGGPSRPAEHRFHHGRVVVRDERGAPRVVGRYDEGRASGHWTIYYPNGRQALRGACHEGAPVGTWRAWDEVGHEVADVRFASQSGLREGQARLNGASTAGAFRLDKRQGTWTTTGDGVTREGPYHHGMRHGAWVTTDASGKESQSDYFLGHPVESYRSLFDTARDDFLSDDVEKQRSAAKLLVHCGIEGADVLAAALSSSEPRRVVLALRSLAKMGIDAAVGQDAIRRAADSAEPLVRQTALLALCETTTDEQRDAALRELIEETSKLKGESRWQLVHQLIEFAPDVLPTLAATLETQDTASGRVAIQTLVVILDNNRNEESQDIHAATFDAVVDLLTEASTHSDKDISSAAGQLIEAVERGDYDRVDRNNWFPGGMF